MGKNQGRQEDDNAEPQVFVSELIRQRERFKGLRLLTMIPAGSCEYAAPEMASHFHLSTFVGNGGLYAALKEGGCDYIPSNISEILRLFNYGCVKPDAVFIQISPPDRDSKGLAGDNADSFASLNLFENAIGQEFDEVFVAHPEDLRADVLGVLP